MADRGQMHPRLYQYRRDRRKFSFRVYLIAAVFAIITIAQWIAALFLNEIKDILMEHYYISIATLLAALILVTLFVFFEGLRFTLPLNWLVSILIVELVTVGLARIVIVTSMENCAYSLAVVSVVTILFIALGTFIRRDFTLDVVIVFVCAIVFFVGSVFFVTVAIVADISYSIMIYCGFVIATVLLFLMYHAQTISGGRYAEMRLNDYLLAALIIYHDFVILCILSMFISTAIAGENKLFNIYTNRSCEGCNTATAQKSATRSIGTVGQIRSIKAPIIKNTTSVTKTIETTTTTTARTLMTTTATRKITKKPVPGRPEFRPNILLPQIYQPQSYQEYQRKYNLANIGHMRKT